MVPNQVGWECQVGGYKGHRPIEINNYPGRAYSLVIETPKSRVFEAHISFALQKSAIPQSAEMCLVGERAVFVVNKVTPEDDTNGGKVA